MAMEKSALIFIAGGARSGKSTFAERVAAKLAKKEGGNLHYIATSRPSDEEMQRRIRRHKEQRDGSGFLWKTWECPEDLNAIVPHFGPKDIVLLDCLTILLANELFSDRNNDPVTEAILQPIDDLTQCCRALVVVSNEVLNEPLPDDPLMLAYARLLGYLHRELVKRAAAAYLVEMGIPVLMKGSNA
jgi:adenosylcobinamide kinase/adenosylcobinamide-phosphate guanylyltransferase